MKIIYACACVYIYITNSCITLYSYLVIHKLFFFLRNVCQLYDSELPTVTDRYIQAAVANISNSVQAELWTGVQLYQGVRKYERKGQV